MKSIIILVFLTATYCHTRGNSTKYALINIRPEMLNKANAIKRFEEIRFEVVSSSRANYIRKVAYTILNEKGDKFAFCLEHYDKLRIVESIEGRLFDAMGNKIKTLKKSDIHDRSGNNEANLADDNRIKYHNFYHRSYPYTVEYEIVVRYYYTMFYPGWLPQENERLSVESAGISVVIPHGMNFRYKALNSTMEPVVADEKSSRIYTWKINNLLALEPEFGSPHWHETAPMVYMGPVQFAVEGYEGNMSTWKDFGKFIYSLNKGRDVLPEPVKRKVHELTGNIADPVQKITVLYQYLQRNTRYVSIQLGVGGWRPFDAQYVAFNGYGDCKALTNYMYALLKEAGIKSYYTLVKAGFGKTSFYSDFPSSQFNHVILGVPLKEDTIWLECTSQTSPPGYLSGFTSDRYVLMVDEDGGKLVKTPRYSHSDNLQERKIAASLNTEGLLSFDAVTTYRAGREEKVYSLVSDHSKDKVLNYLNGEVDLSDYNLVGYHYQEFASGLPSITETLKLTSRNYAQVSGKRLFVSPNVLSRSKYRLTIDNDRQFEIELTDEYMDIDTVEIAFPNGYEPEVIPKDVTIATKYGRYTSSVHFAHDKIVYTRSMEQLSGRFPASEYNEVVKFYQQVYKADRNTVVFTKND